MIGVDVSSGMLAEARRNCTAFTVANVEFMNDLSMVKEKVDFIITQYVLQHIHEKRGMEIIGSLIDRLSPQGIACIHFPYYLEVSPVRKTLKPLVYRSSFLQKTYNLLVKKDLYAPFTLTVPYDVNKILKMLEEKGISNLFLVNMKVDFAYDATIFVERT